MGSNKEAQAARNAADRRLREAHPEDFESFMNAEHEARGLTWKRRATAEERKQREETARQEASRQRILREAEKAGIKVSFVTTGEGIIDLTGDEVDDISATHYDVNNPHDISLAKEFIASDGPKF